MDRPAQAGQEAVLQEIVQEKMSARVSMLVEPMLPTLVKTPFSNPAWSGMGFALCATSQMVKLDSYHAVVTISKKVSRASIGSISIKAEAAILDGEIVALDKDGAPTLKAYGASRSAEFTMVYFAFDLMYLNGESLTHCR